ncbi:MAG: E3 binding domain-containing protein, partial [Bacteroidales bacterium]|nr:E3 binding domain-containing protein [Bacteroidales bacterium]
MANAVIMPRQGQSVETCIITEWYLKIGDRVSAGDLLFAYETDKASFEEVADTDGILLDIFFNVGDEVPVLTNIAVIGEKDENVEEFRVTETGKQKISPRARKLALQIGLDYENLPGTGPGGRIIESDIENAAASMPKITPLAKTMMEKNNLVYDKEKAGRKIRVTAGDLYLPQDAGITDFEDKPLSNVRKLIAKTMYESLRNSAQLTHHTSADARKILELRKKVKSRVESEGYQNI